MFGVLSLPFSLRITMVISTPFLITLFFCSFTVMVCGRVRIYEDQSSTVLCYDGPDLGPQVRGISKLAYFYLPAAFQVLLCPP